MGHGVTKGKYRVGWREGASQQTYSGNIKSATEVLQQMLFGLAPGDCTDACLCVGFGFMGASQHLHGALL